VADINPQPITGIARQPRGAVKLGGTLVTGWVSWEVENNVFRSADTFRVVLAVADLPAARDAAWVASQTSIDVEIFAKESPTDPAAYVPVAADLLIFGQVDDIDYHPALGKIELSGRDLTARLIDTKTSENFSNQTASQIAITLAGRHGLTAAVTATTTKVGNYYTQDHVDLSQEQSEWELLTKLADYEQFDVFVVGKVLHFQPRAAPSSDHYAIVWTQPSEDFAYPNINTTTLSLSRSLTIAKGITVQVRSWNAKQKKAFVASYPKSAKAVKPGQSAAQTTIWHRTIPGLTQDQATQRAKQLYDQIVQHTVKLDADLPGDGLLDCSRTIAVGGTGTSFDQIYFPDSIKRSMSIDEGYRMSVSAKNTTPEVEAGA
jgi:phage protein D